MHKLLNKILMNIFKTQIEIKIIIMSVQMSKIYFYQCKDFVLL